ncbi:Centrosomal protein POC5 [Frankliniella fusca]|uniref:Centrosomal protein POC5 n=1 Tax=Frankliniella fusca TaxID=407009 RepID=A0AAE1HXH3_9NEOP|nr:Centrosomal protein POC5 [Frankliniella fusca]
MLPLCNIVPPKRYNGAVAEHSQSRRERPTDEYQTDRASSPTISVISDSELDILNDDWKENALSSPAQSCLSRFNTPECKRSKMIVDYTSSLSLVSCSSAQKLSSNVQIGTTPTKFLTIPNTVQNKEDKNVARKESTGRYFSKEVDKFFQHLIKSKGADNKENETVEKKESAEKRLLPERQSRNTSVKRKLLDEFLSSDSMSASESGSEKEDVDLPMQSISPPKNLTQYQMMRIRNLEENRKELHELIESSLPDTSVANVSGGNFGSASRDLSTKCESKRRYSSSIISSPGSTPNKSEGEAEDISYDENNESGSEVNFDSSGSFESTPSKSGSQREPRDENASGEDEQPPEYNASDVDPDSPVSVKTTGRKRKEEAKTKRNLGEAYTTRNGKNIRERKRRQIHTCKRNRCQDIIDDDVAETLFVEFWEMGSQERRVQYVASRTESTPVARHRKRNPDSDIKRTRNNLFFFELNGKRVRVCKDTFLKTLDISDTFVESVLDKKAGTLSGTPPDQRGKKAPPHKLKEDKRTLVLNHIESFPKYVSHYCRKDTSQKYLPSSLNIRTMHKLYLEKHPEPEQSVSYSTYQRIFDTLNLKFHQRLSDTCSKCDTLIVKIKHATGEEKAKLEKEHELHKRKAERAYELKRKLKKKKLNRMILNGFWYSIWNSAFQVQISTVHAVIERAKRKQDVINVPSDYYKLVEKAGMVDLVNFPAGKYHVVQMASKMYDFGALLKQPNPLIKRSTTTEKNSFKYMQNHWFRYDKRNPGIVKVKTAFNPDAPFEQLSFRRLRKDSLPDLYSLLQLAYDGPMPIQSKKKEDLLSLLPFIDPTHHAFYQNLTTVDNTGSEDIHPDSPKELHPDDDLMEETT